LLGPEPLTYTRGMEIRGTSALVTGAGRGIGRAIALSLARAGSRVTAVARTASELHSLVREAEGEILAYPGDLRELSVCGGAVAEAVRAHGGLQILVNNAGVAFSGPLIATNDEVWEETLGTNLTAVFRITRAALPHLLERGGHIFMISSLAGINPVLGMAPYCASKAALDHLAQCLMLEVRHQGVKVTTLAPGSVDTTFGGTPRSDASWMLRPEDISQAVLDLLATREDAHLSRVEMRPLRPQKRM
jgi:3-oxoacyl-[acyl-carrier protein] reductase